MKKLLIALTLALTSFVGANQLQAEIDYSNFDYISEEVFTFENVNLFSDHHRLTSNNITLPATTETVDIKFNESQYHTNENDGGVESMIEFYENGTKLDEILLTEIRTGTIGGESYLIPLARYGVANADEVRVNVAQTYSTVPGGYVDFINDSPKPRIAFFAEIIDVEYTPNLDLEFENFNFYGDYNALRSKLIQMPLGVETAIFEFPKTDYNLESTGGLQTKIEFFDFRNNIVDTEGIYGAIGGEYEVIVPPDAVYVRITIMQSYDYPPSGYIGYFNTNSALTYNEFKVADFYIYGDLYRSQEFVKFVEPEDLPANIEDYLPASFTDYKFNGWVYYDENDELRTFDFYSPQMEDIELYASITRTGSLGANLGTVDEPTSTPGNADDNLHTLLGAFNMDNPEGNVIFTVLILLVTNFVLIFTGIKGFALPIVNVAILGLLFFGGFVPFWVMLILSMILGLMFVGMRGGMQQYE